MQLGLARVQQTGTLFWGVPARRSLHHDLQSLHDGRIPPSRPLPGRWPGRRVRRSASAPVRVAVAGDAGNGPRRRRAAQRGCPRRGPGDAGRKKGSGADGTRPRETHPPPGRIERRCAIASSDYAPCVGPPHVAAGQPDPPLGAAARATAAVTVPSLMVVRPPEASAVGRASDRDVGHEDRQQTSDRFHNTCDSDQVGGRTPPCQ